MQNGGRRGKFLSIANMKGGVGKTTTVVSLAEALAADDETHSILIVDLDPQASASVAMVGDARLMQLIANRQTVEDFLDRRLIEGKADDLLSKVEANASLVTHGGRQLDVSLLPCGPKLRQVERELIFELTHKNSGINAIDGKIWQLFCNDFAKLADSFDFIIFDCAPGISAVTESAIRMSDLVIVPTIPDYISVYGLNAFHGSIWVRPGALPSPKSLPHILITRLQATRQHKQICEQLARGARREGNFYKLLLSAIPQSAGLAEALMRGEEQSYTRKYTSAFVDGTLTPLVTEIKELL
jgi:chromosome partitioning protein